MNQNCKKDEGGARGRVVWGGLLILLGGIALLGEVGVLRGYGLRELWPATLVWVGLVHFLWPCERSRFGGLVWMGVGALVFTQTLGLFPLRWSVLWPIAVIFVGLKVLLRRRGPSTPKEHVSGPGKLDVDLVFSGSQESFDGRSFEGGKVRCLGAGYALDLVGSEMVGERAVLDCDVTMGGIELRIPRGWRVEIECRPVLGGIDDATRPAPGEATKALVVRGRILMGGIEIKN